MSKKSEKKNRPVSSKKSKSSVPGWPSLLNRQSTDSPQDGLYRKIFLGASILVLLLTIVLALGSGINADDEYHHDYSAKLVNYYSTFGKDTSALYVGKGTLHYYGGLFDTVTGFVNKAFGYAVQDAGYHNVRHFFNAIYGFLAMLFTALFVRHIAGWRAAVAALIFVFLSPRFLGHSLMNPKDIPFAAGTIMSIYFMARLLEQMPKPSWKVMLGLVISLGIALGARVGALLLFAYLGLFAAIDILIKYGFRGLVKQTKTVGAYAMYILGTALASYFFGLLFWPYGLQNPFVNPIHVLNDPSHGVVIRVLFDGNNIMSDKLPWDYLLQWIWRSIPIFILFGFVGSFFLLKRLFRDYKVLPVFIAFFSALFPILYILKTQPVMHDGWRHTQFVFPSMVVVASLFWAKLEEMTKSRKAFQIGLYAVLGLTIAESTLFILRNTHYPYVYFNSLSGGISHAFGNYETDYWGISMRQAVKWLEQQDIIKPGMQDTVTVATPFLPVTSVYTQKRYGGKVKLVYARFNNRYEQNWDYGLFVSRFFKGNHLREGTWPNSRSIHSINANGVPLISIEKGGGAAFEGERALRQQDFASAITAFQQEVKEHPDNELAWMKLAIIYLNTSQSNEALSAAENYLKICPEDPSGLYYKGMAYLFSGDNVNAEALLRKVVESDNKFANAHMYIAVMLNERNDQSGALQSLQNAIDADPKLKQAYELAATIYEKQGNSEQAARVRAMASQL
jgi:hypothetical protein